MHLFVKCNISILILFLVIAVTIAQNEVAEARDGKGCVFKYFNITKRSHNNAQIDCELWGGTLVIPNSQDVMDLLKGLIVNTTGDNAKELHVGGEKHDDGKFYWSTGEEITANGYSGWPSWGGDKSNPYMGIRYVNKNIFWKSTSSTRYFLCQKEDHSSVDRTCTGRYSFLQTAEYCRGKCYCAETRYGNQCEFEKPVIESCHILPTSIDPLFPLNITCIITGYPVYDQTSVQWKADGKILANDSDDAVSYRVDVPFTKAIVTLVVKRAICLGSLQIKLVVTQPFNGNPVISVVVKEILLNSSLNTIKDIKLDSPACNGTISNVQWNSNAPNHIQKNIYYYITTVPQTETIITSATNSTLTKLSPKTVYGVQITAHISDDATCSKQKESRHANATIVAGFGTPFYVTNLNVTNIGGLACQVSWDFDYLENVNNYTIFIIGETIHARNNVTFPTYRDEVTITSANKTTYWMRIMLPNKKYSFEIFASNCAGKGASVTSLNSCSTPIKAPSIIPKPDLSSSDIDSNGRIKITVNPVNEENGLVSCLLVVVTTKALQSNNTLMTQDQFTEMTNTIGYIAYCIKNVFLTNNVTLGGNEVTNCNVGSKDKNPSTQNFSLVGNNKPIQDKFPLRVYVISVSEIGEGVVYRRSQVLTIAEQIATTTIPTSKNETTNAIVIAIVILLVLLLLLCTATNVWQYRKRLRQLSISTNIEDVQAKVPNWRNSSEDETYETSIPTASAQYENFTFKKNSTSQYENTTLPYM